MNPFIETITSTDPAKRNRSFYQISSTYTSSNLLKALLELNQFRKTTPNLYDKVRAILFLYAGFRFSLMKSADIPQTGKIPYHGFENLL